MEIDPFHILASKSYRDAEMCSKCVDRCCENYAGAAWPEQFGAPDLTMLKEKVSHALQSGKWAIDCWDGYYGEGDGSYLRPAHTNAVGRIRDRSWGGRCVLLGLGGCILPHEERPLGCRLLVPSLRPKSCEYTDYDGNGKLAAATAWEPYHEILEAVE